MTGRAGLAAPLIVGAGALGIGGLAYRLSRNGTVPQLLVRSSDPVRHSSILCESKAGLSVVDRYGTVTKVRVDAVDGNNPRARNSAYRQASVILVCVGAGAAEGAICDIFRTLGVDAPPILVCENLSRSARTDLTRRLKRAGVPPSALRHAISFDVAKTDPKAPAAVTLLHEADRLIACGLPVPMAPSYRALAAQGLLRPVAWFGFAETCKFMLQLAIYDGISCLAAANGLQSVPTAEQDKLRLWPIVERASAATLNVLSRRMPSQASFAMTCRASALEVAKRNAPLDDLSRNIRNIERKLGEDERFCGPAALIEQAGANSLEASEIRSAAIALAQRQSLPTRIDAAGLSN
ncbi:MAG: hypothetical protein QNJ15_13395 [Erythrobacter sp.]|nr:hypothetical protein [Erythrobacter sp.]